MIKLMDYGKPVESSIYYFTDNKLSKINYELYTKNISIRVSENDGKIKRLAYYDAGYSEIIIDKLELRVEDGIFGNRFDFSQVEIYRYRDAFTRDETQYRVELKRRNDNISISIYVDKDNAVVYHKNMGIAKIYPVNRNDSIDFSNLIEEVLVTDFGVISRTKGNITILYNSLDKVSYEYEKHDEFDIDCWRDRCNFVNTPDKKFMVSYSLDNIVESVKCNNELYSRFEVITTILNEGEKHTDYTTINSIYPSLIMSNYMNHEHKFLSIWNHDTLEKNSRDGVLLFSRDVYTVDRVDDLLNELRSEPNKLKISY